MSNSTEDTGRIICLIIGKLDGITISDEDVKKAGYETSFPFLEKKLGLEE